MITSLHVLLFGATVMLIPSFLLTSESSRCPEGWVDCGNGKCVNDLWRCDGDNDCGNLKDEENCENLLLRKACYSGEFQCVANGHCIKQTWHCDGEYDCLDNSDEINCENDTLCSGFLCKDRHCIPKKWKCDGRIDCPDNSDEEGCPKGDIGCSVENGGCSHLCLSSSGGHSCACPTGMVLSEDNVTCTEKNCTADEFRCTGKKKCISHEHVCDGIKHCEDGSDEKCDVAPTHLSCFDEGLCSQQCTKIPGGYSCTCVDGYELVDNACQALGPEPLLIYATLPEIRGIYLRSKKNVLIHEAISQANVVTVDPLESRVYWAEVSNMSSVFSSDIDGNSCETILTYGLMEVEGMAVDYVAKNLYITDSGLRQILACKMDGSMCHVLHQTNIKKPRGIALNPVEGFVYWSDWGDDNVGIYRSGMDGSSRITMVSENMEWPNGIAIDHIGKRLYWVDAKLRTIESITLDGKTRKVIFKKEGQQLFHPFALTMFEDNLYWSDWSTFSVDTYNKFTKRKTRVHRNNISKYVMGVYVHHPVLAINASNPCLSNSCSHMCLIAPMGNYSCVCPSGFKLTDDGRICAIDDDFPMLLVFDDTSIYHLRPGVVGNDVAEELPINHSGLISKMAYDWNTKTLFVSDRRMPAIYAINITSMSKRELVKDHLVTPEDLAFDSTSGNLYWIDSGKGSVEVISTITLSSAVIISDLSSPMSIALVPAIGRMFISTVGENPSISMYDMNGQNRKQIISYTTNALAVHPSKSLLYYADPNTETIKSIDYSNSTSTPVMIKNKVSQVKSLAVNERNVYWTDSQQNYLTILRHNYSHTHLISLPEPKSGVSSRKVIYASPIFYTSGSELGCNVENGGCSHLCLSSPGGHSCACPTGMVLSDDNVTCTGDLGCSAENGGCSHLCLTSPGGHSCACPTGMVLSDDNVTCTERPNTCPGNDFRCKNGRCILSSWKCDRRNDCGDNSDEDGCPTVNTCESGFSCGEGEECIPKLWQCDGERDCPDGSDELECHLTVCDEESQFRCGNGQCIPIAWVCDLATDCIDNYDEMICQKKLNI